MTVFPITLLLAGNVGLGLYLGRNFLRRVENRSLLRGIHLLLGVAVLESLAMVMRGTPNGDVVAPGERGVTAALLVAVSMFGGLIAMLMRGRRIGGGDWVLYAHAAAGFAGLLVFLAWISG